MAFGNRMTLGKSNSQRVERTRRNFGQRMHSRPMPAHIHLRAWTVDGLLLGVAQRNDEFFVALFDATETAVAAPVCFAGSQARVQAAACASGLLGRKVTF